MSFVILFTPRSLFPQTCLVRGFLAVSQRIQQISSVFTILSWKCEGESICVVRKILKIKYLAPTSPSGWNSIDFPQNLLRILNTCIFHPRSKTYKVISHARFILKNFQEFHIFPLFSIREKVTWLQVQPAPSACTPEMGGWWLTWKFKAWSPSLNLTVTPKTCTAI